MDFKPNELEIGIVEKPTYTDKEMVEADNPPSQTGMFRTLTVEEIDARLQSIADKG